MLDLDLDHVKKLSPGWFGAIAGAAVAGAALVPSHRLLAGILAGGGMLLVALKLTPCCDGCAQGVGCGGAAPAQLPQGTAGPASSSSGSPPVAVSQLFDQQAVLFGGKAGCS